MRKFDMRHLAGLLSEILDRVSCGERIRAAHRRRAVGDLVPAGAVESDPVLRELVAAGRLTPASTTLPPLPPLVPGRGSASQAILDERAAER